MGRVKGHCDWQGQTLSQSISPVTVGIPTYARGERLLTTLPRIFSCNPGPAQVIVHVDATDGTLEQRLAADFPSVTVLSTKGRVGPGGGRHRCIQAASEPFFASFDDDSWPLDAKYFESVRKNFDDYPRVALLAAVITSRGEAAPEYADRFQPVVDYTGCGYAIRTDVYRELPGHLDRKIPYGIEERDLSLQLHAAGHQLLRCGNMRVYHDTALSHHVRAEITAGTIENAALIPWLRYPISLWPRGLLQYANVLRFLIRNRRLSGMASGILRSPIEIWRHRSARRTYDAKIIRSFLRRRRHNPTMTTSAH